MRSEDTVPASEPWTRICERRLDRHGLSRPFADASPADVVSAMCGAHAQVMSAAELSVCLRLTTATRADVQVALWTERSLVKTYGPRGTVHLLAARDLPTWHAALSAVPAARDPLLTAGQLGLVVAAIDAVLTDAATTQAGLTADELGARVIGLTGPWAADPVVPAFGGAWPRWRRGLVAAAHSGALCFGPARGRQVTYVHPRHWLPEAGQQEQQTALQELVLQYLRSYGPAAPRHFARWLGAPRGWATELFDSVSGQLEPVRIGEVLTYGVRGDPWQSHQASCGIRLLPYFDAYVVGSYPRELLFPGAAWQRALARGQAGNFPVLLVDGLVGGLWQHRRSGSRISITVEPFAGLTTAKHDELRAQVERIGRILQARPTLAIGPVTIGAHA